MLNMTKEEYNPKFRGDKVIGYCKFSNKGRFTRYTFPGTGRLPLYEYKPDYDPETQYSQLTDYARIDDFYLLVWVIHDYEIPDETEV